VLHSPSLLILFQRLLCSSPSLILFIPFVVVDPFILFVIIYYCYSSNIQGQTSNCSTMNQTIGGVHIQQKNDVYILTMKTPENCFNAAFVDDLLNALSLLEKTTGACALVITAEGKHFSTGLDLNWLMKKPASEFCDFLRLFQKLLLKLLAFPAPTIAAINGHCYAGGAIFSLACDWRIMRQDRGFWCMNEIDIHMGLTTGMNALVNAKIVSPETLRDVVLLGKKYGGIDAKNEKIVNLAVPEDKLLSTAIELGQSVAHKAEDRRVFSILKTEMYKNPLEKLNLHDLGQIGNLILSKF